MNCPHCKKEITDWQAWLAKAVNVRKIEKVIKENIVYDYTDSRCIKGMVDVYVSQLAAAIVKEIRGEAGIEKGK